MELLIIHQNFPGQFLHLANHAHARLRWKVTAIARDTAPGMPGINIKRYKPKRAAGNNSHPYLKSYEDAVLHGQEVFRILRKMKSSGYSPNVIVAHPGWGETLFVKELYPNVPLIHFCEYYYNTFGADIGFDPEFPAGIDDKARARAANALHILNLEQCDIGVTPTKWQLTTHPTAYQSKIKVIHEGIDTHNIYPDTQAHYILPTKEVISAGQPIVTYIARNLEPYRGFHSFMRAIPAIKENTPNVRIIIVGGDQVSYGRKPRRYTSWKERILSEETIDTKNVHFLGKIPTKDYRRILQVSSTHVYLTYPFVLSWSALEAMAAGCHLIGSDTPPVTEIIKDNVNGSLVDFFDSDAISRAIKKSLHSEDRNASMRRKARETACAYSIDIGLEKWTRLICEMVSQKLAAA